MTADNRRISVPDATYLLTVFAVGRRPTLTTDLGRASRHEGFKESFTRGHQSVPWV